MTPRATTKRRRAVSPDSANRRILVVDDSAINRLLVQSLLEENGYPTDTAIDGLQAIELLLRRRYGLILMDLMMPGLTGIETVYRIRALGGRARHVPIVALSAEDPAEIGYDSGLPTRLDGYILKPVHPAELLASVGAWFGACDAPRSRSRKRDAKAAVSADWPLIDETQLRALKIEMSGDSYRTLLKSYLDGARARLGRIRVLLETPDLLAASGEAHDLKSTSGSFGAARLCLLANQLEKACKSGDAASAGKLMASIDAIADDTWRAIERAIADKAGTIRRPARRARSSTTGRP
jgi:two-component system sensor histidine kinase/response regulator